LSNAPRCLAMSSLEQAIRSQLDSVQTLRAHPGIIHERVEIPDSTERHPYAIPRPDVHS